MNWCLMNKIELKRFFFVRFLLFKCLLLSGNIFTASLVICRVAVPESPLTLLHSVCNVTHINNSAQETALLSMSIFMLGSGLSLNTMAVLCVD